MQLTEQVATRFVRLALDCVTREYPYKLAHVLHSSADVAEPRQLTPAFYGCYDWHSAVHGHWLLARMVRLFPEAALVPEARAVLAANLSPENLRVEAEYLRARPGFERPYGLAWLLALDAEHPVDPLPAIAREHLPDWLPKLTAPDRSGQHYNTAFALRLILESIPPGDALAQLIVARSRDFYMKDCNAPVAWEPSGEDFLSPSLCEAWLMQRVLARAEFLSWVTGFFPEPPAMSPVASRDRADGKLAHADGLNLSRAWMLGALGYRELAAQHAEAGLAAVSSEHYAGSHWLATFATFLLT